MELKATSNDDVVFTSLKPMSEAKIGECALFFVKTVDVPFIGYVFDNHGNVILESHGLKESHHFDGFVNLPKFKHE